MNLGRNLGNNLGKNLGRNLGMNLAIDLGKNLGRNLGKNLAIDLRKNLVRNLGKNLVAVYKSGTGTKRRGHCDVCVGTWDLGTRDEGLGDITYGMQGRVGQGCGTLNTGMWGM